jgi:hypothetical protein
VPERPYDDAADDNEQEGQEPLVNEFLHERLGCSAAVPPEGFEADLVVDTQQLLFYHDR